MNRLVLVGNGFDLASGLKASYRDFILFLVNKKIAERGELELEVECELFKIRFRDYNSSFKFDSIEMIFDFPKAFEYQFMKEFHRSSSNNWRIDGVEFIVKSKLLREIFEKKGWSDIERVYFELISILQPNTIFSAEIDKLNSDFTFLKFELASYLKYAQKDFKINYSLRRILRSCIESPRYMLEYYSGKAKSRLAGLYPAIGQQQLMFLNFNYTDVLSQYLKEIGGGYEINQIHGGLNAEDKIIFGYGDEMNEHFKRLEETNDDRYLANFKSNYYGATDNYFQLLDFLLHPFEVIVIGHSLGLSDRLLMNTIFENENCRTIHLYHTGDGSYFKRRLALSRHFDNKAEFRRVLMPENEYLVFNRIADEVPNLS